MVFTRTILKHHKPRLCQRRPYGAACERRLFILSPSLVRGDVASLRCLLSLSAFAGSRVAATRRWTTDQQIGGWMCDRQHGLLARIHLGYVRTPRAVGLVRCVALFARQAYHSR